MDCVLRAAVFPHVLVTVVAVFDFFSVEIFVVCFSRFCVLSMRETASALNTQIKDITIKVRIFFISGINDSKFVKNIASKKKYIYVKNN